MKKKFFKKSLAGLMVMAVLSGTMAPAAMIFASDKKMTGNELEFKKLKTERSEKARQLKDFDGKRKIKAFSADEGWKKTADVKQPEKQNYVEGEVLVKFKKNRINLEKSSGRRDAKTFATSKNLDKKEDIRKSNISVLKIKGDESVEDKIAELKNNSDVEYVQPNFLYYPLSEVIPWGLEKIEIPEAWEISEGTESEDDIIVAVIDTGVAYNHPDLIGNMWDGNNCVDDKGNPLGGCLHGYDYEDDDLDPLPTSSSHGTHIAGTIGAVKNNDKGIIGVAPNVKIMALKGLQILPTNHIVKGINFAKYNGAKVINASWGGTSEDTALKNAISDFPGLFIVAAGNGKEFGDPNIGDNHDESGINLYPCDYTFDNIICVAATDSDDNLADFSDYGVASVDVGAPGVNIYSTTADTEVFSEDFENVIEGYNTGQFTPGGITTNWWGVGNDGYSKVIYTDYFVKKYVPTYPYESNAHTWLISNSIDLSNSNIKGATLSFDIWCDTPPAPVIWQDYIQTAYYNGAWNNAEKYDEDKIKLNGGSAWIDSGYNGYYKGYTEDISNYLSNNFKFSFDWHTDSSVDYNLGCTIDNVKITKYTDDIIERYGYMQGTSMAAPHVAGLAALIWGYKSELSYSEVKDVILSTGDELPDLVGKTTTGKRINAFNALDSLISSGTEVSGNITEDTTWTLENSPYIVTGTVQVYAILTIEPGVEVRFNTDAGLTIGGELNAIGTEDQKIIFTSNNDNPSVGDWEEIRFIDASVDALLDDDENYLSGSIIKYCQIEYAYSAMIAEDSSPYIDNNIVRYGRHGIFTNNSDSIIKNNTIYDIISDSPMSPNLGWGIYLWEGNPTIIGNEIKNCSGGYSGGSGVLVINNVIKDNSTGISGYSIIKQNTITGNNTGIVASGGIVLENIISGNETGILTGEYKYLQLSVSKNNIFDNSDYNIKVRTSADIDAINNYWGTIDTSIIDEKIHDREDDINLGKVIYEPFATAEIDFDDQTAPIITLLGTDPISLFVGDSYTDAGATALDNIDGDITTSIVTINPVDINVAETYIVTYNVSDNAGNLADEVTRTVNVNAVILENIEITNPATKLVYMVGEELDITDLEITGNYNNGATQIEIITTANITGFNSSAPATNQILTVTVDGKTATYTVDIIPVPDTTPPIISETISIPTPTNNNTPNYTFSSDEAGTITYSGGCSSNDTIADEGNNTITFNALADGSYNNCEIVVTDTSDNFSNILEVSDFTIDTTDPIAEETTPVTTPTSDTMPNVGITVENGANWQIKNGDIVLQGGLGTGAEQIITLTGLEEGTYNLTLIATDEAGNTTTINLSEFEIDLSVSPISLSTLPNNPTKETTADITVSGNDIVFYKYNLDSTGYGVEISIDTNIALLGLSEGEHTIFVKGRDGVGNWSAEISETWTVDLTDPNAPIITDPMEAVIINADTYSITGTAEDNSLVEIYSGADLVGSQQLGIGETAYSIEVNLAQNVDNNFTAIATDLAENESASATIPTITEDSIAPVVIITSPVDGWITNQSTITVEYTMDGTFYSDIEDLLEGENIIIRNSVPDAAGNTGSDSIIVILDTIAPTATLSNTPSNPTDQTTTDIIVSNEIDTEAVTHYRYGLDGGVYSEAEIPISINIQLADLSDGEHILSVIGRDEAGNWQSEANPTTHIWTVDTVPADTIPPVITLLGDDPITIEVGSEYIDDGATADDDVDGDITGNIAIVNPVDTTTAEIYTVTYNVSDVAGNVADEVTRTVNVVDTTPPDAVDDLNIPDKNISNKTLRLNWTVPEDADSYDIRQSTAEITDENWDSATQISSPSMPSPKEAGKKEQSVTVNGLSSGTTYYFAMKVSDEVPNESGLSNVVSAKTNTPSGGGGSSAPPLSVSSSNKSLKMLSSQKGTLNQNLNNKNKVKLEIPKGSIKSTTTFTVSEGGLEEGDAPKDKVGAFLFNGLAFNINAVDSSKKAVREFSEDLTITLTVPDLLDDASSLELYYYDEENNEWIIITDIEFGKNTITFKVNHLTQFAVFGTNAVKTSSTSGMSEVKGATTTNIIDGDIIQCKSSDNPFAVYIVKIVGDTKYIRHIVSLEIFNYYGHLK